MLVTSNQFSQLANGSIRPLKWEVRVSFDKAFDSDITWFTLDQSVLDGNDKLAPTQEEIDNLQQWDYYEYKNYSPRVVMAEWTRQMEYPSSVTSAMADFTLENFNNYFTPNSGSPIDQYILPKRPVKLNAGFGNEVVQQFIGLTESMPEINRQNKTATFHAIDFLSQLYTKPLTETVAMQNVRTDEVLAVLFTQFGLQPEQYNLQQGYNTIQFLYFDKGKNAGNAFRELMQAEMGNLWLDETGIIHFEPRIMLDQTIVKTFNTSNVISIKIVGEDNIINKVSIVSDIRKVMAYQKVWSKEASAGDTFVISANSSAVFSASLDDPAISINDPVLGQVTDDSWYTAISKVDQTDVTTGVSLTGSSLRANNFTMFFYNSNAFDVEINAMELWGEPARVVDRIRYTMSDTDSIAKYEERLLEIENNFIQTIDSAEALALTILDGFSEYAGEIQMEVKGSPALQLGDLIYVGIAGYEGNYKIKKITNRMQGGKYTQIINGRRQTLQDWFTLDESKLDSTHVLTF